MFPYQSIKLLGTLQMEPVPHPFLYHGYIKSIQVKRWDEIHALHVLKLKYLKNKILL